MKLLLFLFFLCTTALYSQDLGVPQWNHNTSPSPSSSGSRLSFLQGQVLTQDGSPAAGVTVRITGAGSSQVATTNPKGEFQFTDLQRGSYEIAAESGILSARQTVMLNMDAPEITLRFEGPSTPEKAGSQNSVSVQQLKVPDKARKNYEKAVEEAGKQKTEKALNHLSQALAVFSCYADALTLKGVLDLGTGRVKLATAEAQQAIHCDESNGRAYFVLGAAFNAMGQPQDAVRMLNEGIRFQPDAWQAYYELGKSLLALHSTAAAVSQLKRAESLLQDSFPPLYTAMASALLQMNDYVNARTQLLAFLKAAPDDPDSGKIKVLVAQINAKLQSTPLPVKK